MNNSGAGLVVLSEAGKRSAHWWNTSFPMKLRTSVVSGTIRASVNVQVIFEQFLSESDVLYRYVLL